MCPARGAGCAAGVSAVAVSPGVAIPPGHGETVWARYRSGLDSPDAKAGRQLLISLDTKGVLQLRCWDAGESGPVERELRIV